MPEAAPNFREALTTREIQLSFGIGPKTVRRAIRDETLPAIRIGKRFLVFRQDLIDWMQRHAVAPTSADIAFVNRRLAREGRLDG